MPRTIDTVERERERERESHTLKTKVAGKKFQKIFCKSRKCRKV